MNFWNWIGLPSAADIQELKEASLRQAETLSALTELNRNVMQLLENTQDISEKSDKLTEAARMYYDGISRMVLKQAEVFSAGLESLETFQKNFRKMDKDTQRTLEQVLTECRNQDELLRLLVANSLVGDVSKLLDEDEQIAGNQRG